MIPHRTDDIRKPVIESELARQAPLTYEYLKRFKDILSGRKEIARWKSEEWYTLFRIGPYTTDCWRVVWPHSSNGRLRSAVLSPSDAAVPDQKVILVPFETKDEALYLCALLNSTVVQSAASRSAGMDASPNLIQRLPLPAPNAQFGKIVELAEQAWHGDATAITLIVPW